LASTCSLSASHRRKPRKVSAPLPPCPRAGRGRSSSWPMTDRQLPGVHVGVPLTARCPVLASRAQGVVIGRFSAWAVRGYLLWSFSGELVGRGGTLAGNGGELDGNGGELLGLGGNETAMLLRGRLPRPARVSCAVVSAARWRAARGYPCRSPNDRVNALAALKPQERVLLRLQTLIGPAATACGNGATAEPLRTARRKGRQTDMLNLQPPRHTPTLRIMNGRCRR